MLEFVDRVRELHALEKRLARTASLSLVFGQRRTGKTWMLQHLLDRPAHADHGVYFLADESTGPALLRRFHETVAACGRGGPLWSTIEPRDWSTSLGVLAQSLATDDRPLVLVLDEAQYLLAAEPALPSILQRIWDEARRNLPLHIILCGSALGTMQRLGEADQPLHGRFDLRMQLHRFGHREAAAFAPDWSPVEQMRLYGVFGGLARHLAEVDPGVGLDVSVQEAILDPLAPLHEAPLDILRAEHLSNYAEAFAVLAAIAAGENVFGRIAARAGLTGPRLDYVLKELTALEVVRREPRYGDKPGARFTRYRCDDPFTVFWFRLVRPQRGLLAGGRVRPVWDAHIAPRLADHMGPVFERIVAEALTSGVLEDDVGEVSRVAQWWSRDGQTELDLVCDTEGGRLAVECKWRPTGEVDLPDLNRLRGHVERSGRGPMRLAIASMGRFSDRLRRAADAEGVLLLDAQRLAPAR